MLCQDEDEQLREIVGLVENIHILKAEFHVNIKQDQVRKLQRKLQRE